MRTKLTAAYHIAIPTAFKRETEEVDPVNTVKYLLYLRKLGVHSAMISGTTGEQHSMTADEKIALVNEVDRHPELADEFEVIFGVAGIREREAGRLARRVNESPVIKGALIGFPPYIQPTQAEGYAYAQHLTELCSDKDVIIYNNPEQTGFDISVESFVRLVAAEPNIIGIKETGDWTRVPEMLQRCSRPVFVYAGGEHQLAAKVRVGYMRISSIGGNLFPVEMQEWFEQLLTDPTLPFPHQEAVDEIDKHSFYSYLKDQISAATGIDMGVGRAPIGD